MKFIYTVFFLCILNLILSSSPEVVSATEVVPSAYTSTPGTATFTGPLANTARTYQLLINESLLTGFVGQNLIAISFRSLTSATTNWPVTDITYTNYRIYLSESVAPSNRSLAFFANNVVGPQTEVRTGSLFIPAGSYPFGGSPTAFGPEITFNTPYLYTGGHLLIEIRQAGGIAGLSRAVDALSTSTSGYGTLFSGCWKATDTATFNATVGNFSIIKLTSAASSLKLDLRAFIEGLFDGSTVSMISDTAKVYLRNDFAPYDIVDSAVSVLDANGDGSFTFSNAVNGVNYYIVVDQRNSIDTWSSVGVSFTGGALSYDFTFSASSAFGNNLKFISGEGLGAWTIYSGDVNKDGVVDLSDLLLTANDASNFVTGYVRTDINGDLVVNLLDMLLIYNNAIVFIKVEKPV